MATWAFCPHLAACNKCIVPERLHKDKETSGERREERGESGSSPFQISRFRGFPFNNATQVYKIIRVARVETPPSVSFSVFVSRKGGYGDSYVNRGERAEEKF